ncbi:MAG: quinol:cytochrome C oxidoreductase [Planctomycetes bacterium]|nr:quinol:cytochrome C oxidoreductase [Planctomycetota bacterium]
MTASTVPPIDQNAPTITTRVKEGDLGGSTNLFLGVGAIATIVGIALAMFDGTGGGYFAYLVAYMFTLSIALGALFFVLVQHITRAGWSVVVRRLAENMTTVFPVLAILFLPIAIGGPESLYHHWWHVAPAGSPAYDEIVAHKAGYLNPTFFYVRAAFYFAVWIGLSRYFRNASVAQDQNGDPAITMRLARRAAPGLLLFAITTTFAAFDWIMSIDPHWFSTMFGVTYFAGSVMAFYAVLALVCMWLRGKGYLGDIVNTEHYHDIGKLMFAFMVFWTYVNFSQYMLIYYANLPEETHWYQYRSHNGWDYVGPILIFGHFLAPFAFLLSRHVKRNRPMLAFGAVFLLVMHWIDMQYLIMPVHQQDTASATGLEFGFDHIASFVGLLFLFLGWTLRTTSSTPLVPERDPRLRESLKFHNI